MSPSKLCLEDRSLVCLRKWQSRSPCLVRVVVINIGSQLRPPMMFATMLQFHVRNIANLLARCKRHVSGLCTINQLLCMPDGSVASSFFHLCFAVLYFVSYNCMRAFSTVLRAKSLIGGETCSFCVLCLMFSWLHVVGRFMWLWKRNTFCSRDE